MKKKADLFRVYALLTIVLTILYFYLNLFFPRLIPPSLRLGMIRKPFNLLIVGTDITFDSVSGKPIPNLEGRADTIILAHIDPVKQEVNLVSIPRDTLVAIPGYGQQKINASSVYGGIPLLEESVSGLTGKKIDHYLEVKPAAVTKLVDLLGGVTLLVEKDMRYVDRAQKLDINLKEGWQKLSGKKAHEYIRFRHDLYGDIGRIERQQNFLKALIKTSAKPSNIIKAPFAISLALQEIKTDLPLTQTIRLLNFSRTISFGDIKTHTISGESSLVEGAGSVWLINKNDLNRIIKEFF
ncbi:MAG: LCP family protein [Candidatus Margulisbacteria bacterium]|nr:LCP family protein [Candidatus Margulisiibacteriota bacterium]